MTLTRTKFEAYLKEVYVQPNSIMLAMVTKNPLLGMMKKRTDLGGDYVRVPITRVGPQGRSATYATALANAVGSETEKFLVTYASNYAIAKLSGDVVDDSKNSANSVYEAIDHEMKGAFDSMSKDIRNNLFGNLGGSRGQIATGGVGADPTLTLANAEDSVNFEVGMEICDAATDGTSGSLRDSGQAITLIAIDRVAGTLEADENWSEIASIAAGDYLFCEGDFGSKWSGLAGWIPSTAPTSGDSFFGVDRSDDVNRLAGIRYDGSGETIESAFVSAGALGTLHDAEASVGVLNPIKWSEMAISLGATERNRITTVKDTTGRVGYSAIMLATASGDVPVIADPGCPVGVAYLLDMSTWVCGSVKDLVHIIDDDGLRVRRINGSDGWMVELKSRGNFYCDNPGRNVRIGL